MENSNSGQRIEIKIVVLTYDRPEVISTPRHVAECIVCLPQAQESQYKEVNPDFDYIPHPDNITSLSAKKQWIYDKFRNVCIMDDNITGCQAMHTDGARVSPLEVYALIQEAGNICRQMGKYLFGFSQYGTLKYYNPLKPFRLTGYIPGNALGMLEGSGLKFSQQIIAAQAYYICGMNAHLHRTLFKDTRWFFMQGKVPAVPADIEKADLIMLRKLFGDAIRIKKGSRKGGEYSTTLQVPF